MYKQNSQPRWKASQKGIITRINKTKIVKLGKNNDERDQRNGIL